MPIHAARHQHRSAHAGSPLPCMIICDAPCCVVTTILVGKMSAILPIRQAIAAWPK